jgi:hypothetical protein
VSAPVSERTRTPARGATARGATRSRSTTIPAQRGGPAAGTRAGERAESSLRGARSQQQAYAGRDDRARRATVGRPVRTAAPARRPQFVLLVMVLLAVGLVATLWLSTAAAAGSYHLQAARGAALALSQQSERLHREVADLESAPELARRAEALGMVPVQDSARLVVAPDGSVTVVGQPRAAIPPPPPPAPPAAPAQPSPPGGQAGAPASPGAGGPASAVDSAPSGDPQEPASPLTGTQGDANAAGTAGETAAAGTQGATAGAGSRGNGAGAGTQGDATTAGAQGGSATAGASGAAGARGQGDAATAGSPGGAAGTRGGVPAAGTTGAGTAQVTGGADGTGNG